jgi:two-component system, cell cycle sensor histidine kinase and response regulator CckA
MTESSVHKLLSGLTAIVPPVKANLNRAHDRLSTSRTAGSHGPDQDPQVVIYTRKWGGDYAATFISDNVVSQFGYSPSDFVNSASFWMERIHPEDAPVITNELRDLAEHIHQVHEYRFRHKNGEYRWIRDELNLICQEDGIPLEILGTLVDVTEIRRAEESLRRSEWRYRSLVESSPVGMVSFDVRGEITEFNPAVLNILGAPSVDKSRPLDLFSLFPMAEAGISEAILQCLESGDSSIGEFEYKSKQNRLVCTRLHVVPIRDGDNRITGVHAFVQDISDQKRAEELIIRSERLKVLGQISAGVGHTFSNLLQVVSGNSNMALTNLELQEYESVKLNLDQIVKSTKAATEAVRWLQQFGRERPHRGIPKKEVFDLSESVQEAIEVAKLWSKAEVERKKIQVAYDVDLLRGCWVEGVSDQVAWMAFNILKNAVEALPRGGKIKIRTSLRNEQVILTVQDNGVGIRTQDIKHITVAFWTSKEAHAGIGLAFSCGIIRQHGGTMGVKRMKPRGTIFTVRLPWIKDPSEKRKALAKEVTERGFRILLIDDDEPVIRIFEKGLRILGQTTYSALSGQQGLSIFKELEVDVVICDLAMAGVNGWEVARGMNAHCIEKGIPRPPFIMLTGWAGQLSEEEILAHPEVDRIVQKPINVPALLEIMADEISRASTTMAFSGMVEGIDLLEYMQLMILTGKPVLVEVLLKTGLKGLIYLDKGHFLHATCGDLEGEEAVYRCVNFAGGSFSNLPWQEPERVSIDRPGEFLLLEAARRRDDMKTTGQHKITREIPRPRVPQDDSNN